MAEDIRRQIELAEKMGQLTSAVDHLRDTFERYNAKVDARLDALEASDRTQQNESARVKGGANVAWIAGSAVGLAIWQWILAHFK